MEAVMKYNEDNINDICDRLKQGKGRVISVKGIITYETFCQWMKDEEKTDFTERIKKAELEGNQTRKEAAQAAIFKAFDKQWTAGAWWLERNYPEEYGSKQQIDLSGGLKLIKVDE